MAGIDASPMYRSSVFVGEFSPRMQAPPSAYAFRRFPPVHRPDPERQQRAVKGISRSQWNDAFPADSGPSRGDPCRRALRPKRSVSVHA